MKITDLANAPQWLRDAKTENEDVEINQFGHIDWHSGVWHSGDWHGGTWRGGDWRGGNWYGGNWYGGTWRGGDWRGGNWRGGDWRGGYWHGGDWHSGDWHSGVWYGGDWRGGDWRGGTWYGGNWYGGDWHGGYWHGGYWHSGDWHSGTWRGGNWYGGTWRGGDWHGGYWDGPENRLDFMAAMLGIVYDAAGIGTAYRSTQADGHGRHTREFIQPAGEYYEENLPPAGKGTCIRGIHVSTAATAWNYFGIGDPTAQLWRVRFRREDLLDCDGEKARIRGGTFERIPWPFAEKPGEVA